MNAKMYHTSRNIDQKEINKFERVATHWWNLEGELKLLHRINQLRTSYIAQQSGGLFNKTVLDIGCGGGILTEEMAREGAIVTGLDVSFELLKIAHLHALEAGLRISYLQETVEEHAAKYANQYDIVSCMEVLEHVPNPKSVVQACAQLVRPNGEVFFSTINRSRKAWLIAIIGAEYIFRIIPKGTHNMKKFIKPSELLSWIDSTCLEEQHITGICYNPIIGTFRLWPSVTINYMLHTTVKLLTT